jgi:Uncharacterized protein conserved in bacteria
MDGERVTKYAAFFRGINVGGRNKVKMADLKQLFHDCGFREVITYIQSGNVIFESDHDKSLLPDVISHAFEKRFAFQSHVVLRSGDEMHAMMSAFPFTNEEMAKAEAKNPDVEHVYVFLSGSTIDSAAAEALRLAYDGEDKFHAAEHELYLLCYNGVRDSRLAASFSKLDASLTARNQKTLLKICELLDADKPDSSAH